MKSLYALVTVLFLFQSQATLGQQGGVMPVLFLNGSGAHAVLPTQLTDDLVNATVEAWVRWESLNRWSRVFDFGKEGNAAVLQNQRQTATLFFSFWDRTGELHRAEGFKAIEPGTWQHMAVVCGKMGMKLYVNGQLAGEDAYKLPFSAMSGGTNYIGKSNWPDDAPFHGYIAEFRVWASSRTQAEIQQTMFTQLKGDEPNLAGYWRFETSEGNVSPDLTAGGHHATLKAGATVMSAPGPAISKVSLEPPQPAGIQPADLHQVLVQTALEDSRIEPIERRLLDAALDAGELTRMEADEIEQALRKKMGIGPQTPSEETLYTALERAHADGVLKAEEAALLSDLASTLQISETRVAALTQSLPKQAIPEAEAEPATEPAPAASPEPEKPVDGVDAYRVLLKTALEDRIIGDAEAQMLKQVAESSALPEEEIERIGREIRKELGIGPQTAGERTYFKLLKTAFEDGALSDNEKALLEDMKGSLGVSDERAASLRKDAEAQLAPATPQPEAPEGQ